jgi:UDPglucose 6-dehydrogenase
MVIKRISVVGLGKLGLCLAAVLAHRGFSVIGVDVDEGKVESVNRGVSPIFEPGLGRLIRSNRHSLRATADLEMAIRQTDATFIVVPTPSNRAGEFSLKFVKRVLKRMGKALSSKVGYHLIVLTSTVMPGSLDEVVRPTLEKESGKQCGKDFGICYNPEFIALGDVVDGLLNPDFVLIGESDRVAGDLLAEFQGQVRLNSAPVERMSFQNAEVTKIAVNSFVTMKMSFANTLAEICELLPEGDVDKVTKAIGRDKRIGPHYLKGAIGYGGPCFPRDNLAFGRFAGKLGVNAELARATDKVNRRQVRRIVELVESNCTSASGRVGILGITYKPNTDVVEGSQPLEIANALARKGYDVHVYDPAVRPDELRGLSNVHLEPDAEMCIRKSDLCVIATPWERFSKIERSNFSNRVVLDCWRILDGGKNHNRFQYLPLGREMIPRTGPWRENH